ncbi:glycoside hydrolase family 99-like domain-containing protein [Kribbella sp. NBC_00889]|uniref:glycoside hydrolase family 99-like domain-containing protein n=1 Tax=Kribbella sp. NBC_00889 TaxID=2975974 RepID=UPI00386C93CA|nr:glycoside hydrolase family 99-like domain-containing protein [Kribbella sp. NBC_00889]
MWDQSPDEFAAAVGQAVDFVERWKPRYPVITVNAWNEWTDGSYLLPATTHRLGYLEAIRDILGTH